MKWILTLMLLINSIAYADEIADVRQTLSELLPKTKLGEISKAELPGLYRVVTGANVIYFNPEKQLMFMGEIMTTDGKNLTASHRLKAQQAHQKVQEAAAAERSKAQLAQLPQYADVAFTIQYGEPKNVIYEFSNPDCGVCRHLENYLDQVPLQDTVRHIFFLAWSPQAARKLEHIMCSNDPEAQMHAIYRGADVTDFATCEEGKDRVQQHGAVAQALGVSGTPTLIVNGTRFSGFRPGLLAKLLKSEKPNELNESVQSE